MKKFVVALSAVGALTGSAVAADLPMKAPAVAPMVRATSWTGCYIGLGGGFGTWAQDNQSFALGIPFNAQHTDRGHGWFGTGQVGCDYLLAPQWVIGAFGDIDFGNIRGTLTDPGFGPDLSGSEKERWSWAVGARAGYLPWDSLLLYLAGGFTRAHFDSVSLVDAATGAPVLAGVTMQDATYNGWFLGAGYEYRLDWLPGLAWKTEYRYADYGSRDNLVLNGGVPTIDTIHSHKAIQTIRTALVYRFNLR